MYPLGRVQTAIKQNYTIVEDWKGTLYCGITLDWNYKEQWVDISMTRYIQKVLQRLKHSKPKVTTPTFLMRFKVIWSSSAGTATSR
jgi:hypothetical protein